MPRYPNIESHPHTHTCTHARTSTTRVHINLISLGKPAHYAHKTNDVLWEKVLCGWEAGWDVLSEYGAAASSGGHEDKQSRRFVVLLCRHTDSPPITSGTRTGGVQ